MRLRDKVAVITGATGRMGREIALAYAEEGADLFLQDFPRNDGRLLILHTECTSVADGVRKPGQRVASGTFDITKPAEVEAMTRRAIEEFGRIDILVNTQSGSVHGVVFDITEDEWDWAIDMGVKSYFLTCQYIGKEMARRGGGKIINLTSIVSRLGSGGAVPWSATCGARDAMMRAMAHALGAYGIRVNSLGHGRQEEGGGTFAEVSERLRRLPLGRVGRATDVIGPAIFLASDESSFVTGTVLYADGGYTSAAVTDDEHRPKHVPFIGD